MKYAMFFIIVMLVITVYIGHSGEAENREKFGFKENLKIVLKTRGDNALDSVPNTNGYIRFQADTGVFIRKTAIDRNVYLDTYISTDAGSSWNKSKGMYIDTFSTGVSDIYFDNKHKIYVQIGAVSKSVKNESSLIISTDMGNSWERYSFPFADVSFSFVPHMTVVDSTLFLQYLNRILFTDLDGKYELIDWERYPEEDNIFWYESLSKAREDNSLFYKYRVLKAEAGQSKHRLRRSTDGGETWDTYVLPWNTYGSWQKDRDTWFVGYNNKYEPEPKAGIMRITDSGLNVDTLFTCTNYLEIYGGIEIFGNNCQNIVFYNRYNCIAASFDAGETFEYIINPEEVETDDFYSIGFCNPDKLFIFSSPTGYLMMYSPTSSVDADIAEFQTKLYPNPARTNSKIYLSLENDRPRAATCRIYNLSGTLLDESRELQIPRGYHTIDFRTEGYAPGAYFVVIESEGEVVAKEKFVIAR